MNIDDIRRAAEQDAACAAAHGVDLNPFSTESARSLWAQGWAGTTPHLLVEGSQRWRLWERGRQARLIHDQKAKEIRP